MYLHGAYLLWYVLEWAGGENRGVRNVYQSIGLDGSWDCWRVGWLGWKLVWCSWFLCTYTYVLSQCIAGNLTGISRHCRRDNSLLYDPPTECSFIGQTISSR